MIKGKARWQSWGYSKGEGKTPPDRVLAEALSTLRIICHFVQVLKLNTEASPGPEFKDALHISGSLWNLMFNSLKHQDQLLPFSLLVQEISQMEWGGGRQERENTELWNQRQKPESSHFIPPEQVGLAHLLFFPYPSSSKKRNLEKKIITS